jgi:hypothetical protein
MSRGKWWGGPLIALVVILGLIVWPFEALYQFISRRLPGAHKRVAQAELERIRGDAESAVALANGVAPDAPEIAAKIAKYAAANEKELERHIAKGGWAQDFDRNSVWSYALETLQQANRIAAIDWRSEPDELKDALDPLLTRQTVTLDWSFLDALERASDWEALKNENLLPRVASEVAKHGLVLAHINEGSDSYVFAVCTPDQFKAINGLTDHDGHMQVGRLA